MRAGIADYRFVHFATHGLVDSQRPELSGLVLSLVDPEGRPRNGLLRAHEVSNLSLGADMVVLSACRTALGKDIRGDVDDSKFSPRLGLTYDPRGDGNWILNGSFAT